MSSAPEKKTDDIDPERLDSALRSFWRGSTEELESILDEPSEESEPGICQMLGQVVEAVQEEVDPPARLDDYTIIRQIGQGASAVVYEARQNSTGRSVALKVVRRWGVLKNSDAYFFRREVDSLARLKHANIATLYDAGATSDGQHFFAMELVEGKNLADAFSDQNDVNQFTIKEIHQRVRLVGVICAAISHAHHRGIIHCDLKPSNIFLDEQGSPKVLDFGLSQFIDPEMSLITSQTDTHKIIGTLSYMSPEQARGRLDEIDTRSDVYSLGVILYELLTGHRPHEWRGRTLPAMLRDICEAPIKRPSSLCHHLRGDLDIIIMKALEKEPDRRYESAAALADDLDRYLSYRPILARPPSAIYQLRKLVVRNKVPATLMGAMLVLAIVFGIAFVRQASRVREQRDLAQSQAARAQHISDYLSRMFASVDPKNVGSNVSVREVLDKAAAGLEGELSGDPEIRASLHDTLGRSYMGLRLFDRAEKHLDKALILRSDFFGEHSAPYAASLHQLGVLANQRRQWQEALGKMRQAYEIRRDLFSEESVEAAESLLAMASVYRALSDLKNSEESFRNALALNRRLLGRDRRVAESLHQYGAMLVAGGRYDEAEPMLIEALATSREILGDDHFDVALIMRDLSEIYQYRGQAEKAEGLDRERIRILRKVFPDGHKELDIAISDLAVLLESRQEFREAETFHREAIAMEERVMGKNKDAYALNNYGAFLCDQGRWEEAEPLVRATYRIWNGDAERPHEAQGYACQNLAELLLERGRFDEAEELYQRAEHCWRKLFGDQHPKLAKSLIGLGRLAVVHGRLEEAERYIREAVDVRQRRLGEDHPDTSVARVWLASVLLMEGNLEAAKICQDAVNSLRQKLGDHHEQVSWALPKLAMIEKSEGCLQTAEQLYSEAIYIERSLPREHHPVLAEALAGLADVYISLSNYDDAEPLLQEALFIQRERYSPGDDRIEATQGAVSFVLSALDRKYDGATSAQGQYGSGVR